MKNENKYDMENTRTPATIEQLQDDLQNLRSELRSLEFQVAALSNISASGIKVDIVSSEPPHEALGKFQVCKSCKNMRLPHKSNPHYSCNVRHETVEPKWTCGLYHDKKSQRISESVSYFGN